MTRSKTPLTTVAAVTLCVGLGCVPGARPAHGQDAISGELPHTDFAESDLWHDGRAEVSVYDGTRSQYGETWEFEWRFIVVKEEFDPDLLVKDDRPDEASLPVMKVHTVFEMPTDNYPYNFATSVFVDRRDPFRLHKQVGIANEWCGITTRELIRRDEELTIEYDSYFQSEASGTEVHELGTTARVTEEQLFFAVRALPFEDGLELELEVLNRQIDSHFRPTTFRDAELTVSGPETVEDATGNPHEVWRVDVDMRGDDHLVYWVGTEDDHLLIAHEGPGGVTMRLRESRRWAYWAF